MTKPQVQTMNVETGEIERRDMTDDELTQFEQIGWHPEGIGFVDPIQQALDNQKGNSTE